MSIVLTADVVVPALQYRKVDKPAIDIMILISWYNRFLLASRDLNGPGNPQTGTGIYQSQEWMSLI